MPLAVVIFQRTMILLRAVLALIHRRTVRPVAAFANGASRQALVMRRRAEELCNLVSFRHPTDASRLWNAVQPDCWRWGFQADWFRDTDSVIAWIILV